jgi:hypothetical protein
LLERFFFLILLLKVEVTAGGINDIIYADLLSPPANGAVHYTRSYFCLFKVVDHTGPFDLAATGGDATTNAMSPTPALAPTHPWCWTVR